MALENPEKCRGNRNCNFASSPALKISINEELTVTSLHFIPAQETEDMLSVADILLLLMKLEDVNTNPRTG